MTNTITASGALGRDAELRFTKAGQAVLNLNLADGRSRRLDDGSYEEQRPTLWHNVTIWGALAEMWAESGQLVKGARVDVTGELTVREYEHQGEKRWQTEIRAYQVGVRDSNRGPGGSLAAQQRPQASPGGFGGSSAGASAFQDPWAASATGFPENPPF